MSSEVKYVFKAGIGLISLEGEIDYAIYPELNKFLSAIFDAKDCPLIIDLSRVTFIDNTGGLRAIRETAGRIGLDRVAIVNANDNIKRLLVKADMSEFAQFTNVAKASAALSGVCFKR